jgi:ankyrin repeat protein
MNLSHTSIPPSQTSDTYNPNLQSAPPSDTHEPQGKGPNRDTTPKLSSKADNTEDFWLQLEALHRMAQERKKIEEAANKTQPISIESSDPSLHSHQRQVSDRQGQSSLSTENGSTQHDEKHNEQKGGVDPDFFEELVNLNRKKASIIEINEPKPERIPGPGPRVNGEWTSLHLLAERDPNRIPELIASGASLDAVTKDGLTLLHTAFFRKDADAMRQLLAAGANPLIRHGIYASPLAFALVTRKELAMTLAEALPANAKANVEEDGDTEIHMAVQLPEVLYVLLSKGMQDSANGRGVTALMMAAEDGQLQSVKYLLGQRPQNEKESDYLGYINSTDNVYNMTALGHACYEDYLAIVELLLKHGADLYHPSDQRSLLKVAADHGNIPLLNLLLENGATEYEADLTYRLLKFVNRGQSEAVQALGPYVILNQQEQYKLLSEWTQNPQAEMLAEISPLIAVTVPSARSMIEGRGILTIPLAQKSPGLLAAVLEFFDRRDTFNYVLQRYISIFLDGQGEGADTVMGKVLLDFALSRFSSLKGDRETVMRLLQLSEKLQDYCLATLIKDGHDSTSFFKSSAIPFIQKWISDPVMRDFLSDVPNSSSTSKGIWLGKKLV